MKAFDCVKTNGQLQQKIDYYTKSSILSNWIDSYYEYRCIGKDHNLMYGKEKIQFKKP